MEATANDNEKLSLMDSLRILFGASKVFWLVNLVNFADGIAYFGILTLLTRFLGTRLGMPDSMVGISVSAFTGLVTLFMFGGGFVSDKLGVRNALTLSLMMLLGGRVLTVVAPFGGSPTPAGASPGWAWRSWPSARESCNPHCMPEQKNTPTRAPRRSDIVCSMPS
ncbi:MAG TPA: hypothetical protein PKM25_05985 [Candidatus Ozemobacteraceae bacterium]|nr:hypothetical protein [Candidatus Ozemobacteraceae bacterium]